MSPQLALGFDATKACVDGSCRRCREDLAFLQRKRRPNPVNDRDPLRVVDLFAGCGAMSLGLAEGARRAGRAVALALAVDSQEEMIAAYAANLAGAATEVADVTSLFPGPVGAPLTADERALAKKIGRVDLLLGGPPCQGHSDLNNHTRRRDPKNALYLRMARAAEVLRPKLVIVENVVAVQHDERGVVDATAEALRCTGYAVASRVIDLRLVGVPQRRRRHLLMASRLPHLDPASTLESLAKGAPGHPDRTVRWAIEDLMAVKDATIYDTVTTPSERNARRIDHLFDNDVYNLPNRQRPECHRDGGHTYVSMYGRLRWNEPAQTITTGFGSMGQGRYVHPARRRTITPHEAARLQTFPDWYDFGDDILRTALATMIGNAVPPLLMVALGQQVIPLLPSEPPAHPPT
ncbi:MAG TPA: DNA cytosine methyltransferase [Thermoanaerobaculia bacterium]|nr:DNA cytosine methyltransferase [Thermoanaerobaculia bacterium]